MDKVKCKCGVYGKAGVKCKACSSMVLARGGIITDPDPALYVLDDSPITFSEDTNIEHNEVVINVNEDEEDGRE